LIWITVSFSDAEFDTYLMDGRMQSKGGGMEELKAEMGCSFNLGICVSGLSFSSGVS